MPSCVIWPGQRSSANTRASGRSATPALISEPPPRPQPTSTCISSPSRTSNSADVGPVRSRLPVTCISFFRSGKRLGKAAGQHLAPALQHGDRLAGARQARRCHAAAVARADDDDVVAVADVARASARGRHAPILVADFQLTDFTQPNYGPAARIDSKISAAIYDAGSLRYPSPATDALIPPDLSIYCALTPCVRARRDPAGALRSAAACSASYQTRL